MSFLQILGLNEKYYCFHLIMKDVYIFPIIAYHSARYSSTVQNMPCSLGHCDPYDLKLRKQNDFLFPFIKLR